MESLVCPEKTCGRKFTRSFNLNRHYQNFHLNSELVEKCFLCAQLFPSCEELQKHYSRFHRPSRKFFLKESAFKRSFVTYRYNYMEQDINFASSQLNIKEKIEERLLSEAALKTVCKTSLIFIAQMAMLDHSGNVLSEASIPFRSPSFLVTTSSKSNLRKNIKKSFAFQQSSLDEFLRNGSGWRFNRALAFDIEVARVRPITGGNNTNLNLKNFRQKIFLYNPCNKDEKCFLYCIAHYLYQDKLTETEKKKREEKKYKKFIKRFDIANISFPISISGIKKFLKQNQQLNLKINILYRDTKDRIFPLEYGLGNGKNIATLLMVEKKSSNHFVLITNPNKYLRSVYRTSNGSLSYERAHFCLHCLNSFCRADLLKKHEKLCLLNNPKAETTPEKGSKHEKIQFKNFEKCHKLEFTGYLDFECVQNSKDKTTVCHTCERLKCTCDASFTEVISKQIPIAFSFLVLGPDKQIIHEYSFAGKNAHEHLIEHLLEQEETWIENLLTTKEEIIMTSKNKLDYNKATNCYLCFEEFSDTVLKVRDHCHYNSKFLGAACSTCNLRRRKPRKIPIFMHNGSRFDLHFIVKALGKFPEDVKNISVLPYNGENFRTLSFNCFEFVDSLAFLQASLSQLSTDLNKSGHDYPILKQTSLVNTDKKFDKEKYQMILGKSFFPYEYCKNLPQMYASKKLPSIEHFYSQLSEKSISKEDHKFAKTVWKKFKCRHLVDYTLIYCKIDVLLLSEIFESFRDEMIQFSGLDPAHYISLPAYTFDSMLKTTNAVFELPTDIDMVHFLENAKRGGMSIIGTRHLTPSCPATSKTKKSGLEEEESELIYIDANNLYGYAQMQKLPSGKFRWLNEHKTLNFDINSIDLEGKYGYFIECDLEYPKEIHDLHQNLPLAPEVLEINYDSLSPYAQTALIESDGRQKYKDVKLMATFADRINYITHSKNLKLYLDLGMKLKKIHRILKFRQKLLIAPYIEKCTIARQKATSKFQMDQYKKLANANFGKTLQNVRDYISVKLHNNEKSALKAASSHTFKNQVILDENLIQTNHTIPSVFHNKPIAVGVTILELSKHLMFDFFYNRMLKNTSCKFDLGMSDTDSFLFKVTKPELFWEQMKPYMDFSNYPETHKWYSNENKAKLGYFKDEFGGVKKCVEFIGLRAKCYCFNLEDNETKEISSKKTCKGIGRTAISNRLKFEQYKKCLMEGQIQRHDFASIRSSKHILSTIKLRKKALSHFDCKRFLFACGIHSLPYNHYKIKQFYYSCPFCK